METNKEIYIKVTKNGPYMLYGAPPVVKQTIIVDEEGISIEYANEGVFEIKTSPVALCRCDNSKNSPFCDGSHINSKFDGTLKAEFNDILDKAQKYEGPTLTLFDNEKYCAFARFCDANSGIWELIFKDDDFSISEVKRQADMCPSGRLIVFDKQGNLIETKLEKSIGILEDTNLRISGPLWLKGSIRVENEENESYQIRTRQTLCRCGRSSNKPFCDCTHRHIHFKAQYKI